MVRRVLNIVYREVRGLHQAAYVLGLFAFGSQLLALVRDRMLAHQFGAGYELDLYYAAFRIPDLLYVLFASTLSVYVLIPFVARARESSGGDAAARAVLAQVFTVFLAIYSILALLVALFAPQIVSAFFPAYADDPQMLLLLRIMLLQPFFLGVSSLFGVVTQLGHRFVLFAVSPLIYNLGIILGIAVLYPMFGLPGLAYGVVIGAVGHMLIQWPFVRKSSLSFTFLKRASADQMFDILKVSVPRAITLSIQQVVLLVFVSVASVMAVGSVSVYQFAYNLQSVPLAIIGVSYSVAAFPVLAELFAKKKYEQFSVYIISALRHIIFWSLPVIALVIVLRAQLVRVVLGSGAFDWSDTRLTAAVLALFSFSLLAQAINLVAVRSFYAGGNTKVPFYAALLGGFTSVLSALVLVHIFNTSTTFSSYVTAFMRVADVPGSEVLMLSLGYSLGVLLQTVVLLFFLYRTLKVPLMWMGQHVLRGLTAAIVAGASAYTTLNFLVAGINMSTFVGVLIQGGIAGTVGVVGAGITYALLQSPELKEVGHAFQKRLFKSNTIISPQEEVL